MLSGKDNGSSEITGQPTWRTKLEISVTEKLPRSCPITMTPRLFAIVSCAVELKDGSEYVPREIPVNHSLSSSGSNGSSN